jgi:hypothetical protein
VLLDLNLTQDNKTCKNKLKQFSLNNKHEKPSNVVQHRTTHKAKKRQA